MPKRVGGVAYAHRQSVGSLKPEEQDMIDLALKFCGWSQWNIVKVNKKKQTVSFLKYKDFNHDPHPELVEGVLVNLEHGHKKVLSISKDNPPVLHRKELFIEPTSPFYKKWRAQTLREDRDGLLSRKDIGTKKGWLAAKRGRRRST